MEKLYDIKEKVIKTLASGVPNQETGPVCEVFTFRGTTFICRGLPLEGKDIQQESIMILVETVKEASLGSSPLTGGGFIFTARERAVANLIVQGLANKEISSELGIGIHTVKDHVKNIMEKLETHTRSGIVAKLMEK
jgi:DNA-binding CsgD family transcriptional regulator